MKAKILPYRRYFDPSGTGHGSRPRQRAARVAREGAIYGLVAVAATWPLASRLSTAIPLGTETVPTVPLYSLWILWWDASRVAALGSQFWAAPMFYPVDDALAFSEPLILPGLGSFPLWAMGSAPLAYNLVLLAVLTANGWAACRLLSAARFSYPVALLGGTFIELLPVVQQEVGVLPLLGITGVLWMVHAMHGIARRPTLKRGALLGLAGAVSYALCNQYTLFAGLLLAVCAPLLLGRRLRSVRTWAALAVAALVAAVPVLPVATAQLAAKSEYGFHRSKDTVQHLAATTRSYLYTPWKPLVPYPGVETAPRGDARAFFPGGLKWLLAIAAISGVATRRRRWTRFWLAVAALAVLLSMGPNLADGPLSPYRLLASTVPGFSQVRGIWRFAVFFQIGLAFLAAAGLEACFGRPRWFAEAATKARGSPEPRRRRSIATRALQNWRSAPRARLVGLVLVGGASVVEVLPARQTLYEPPSFEKHARWISWIEENTAPRDVVAYAPFPEGPAVSDFVRETEWLYLQTAHGRRTPNGYSSYFPASYRLLSLAMRRFPEPSALAALRRGGVRYVVVDRAALGEDRARRARAVLRPVLEDERSGFDVLALREPEAS